ncbi:hypothetical protein O1L68_05350 [Streptomyces lydicus]|nr:hypothetical protein [Streptomyces lydicus]
MAEAQSLTLRPVTAGQLRQARGGDVAGSLFRVEWMPLAADAPAASLLTAVGDRRELPADLLVSWYADPDALRAELETGTPAPGDVVWCLPETAGGDLRSTLYDTLGVAQEWLRDERLADTRLTVLTSGAVAVGAGEDVPGLAAAAARGLLGSAQSGTPGRLRLVDIDQRPESWRALPAALALDEPQLAVRAGRYWQPGSRGPVSLRSPRPPATAPGASTPPAEAASTTWRCCPRQPPKPARPRRGTGRDPRGRGELPGRRNRPRHRAGPDGHGHRGRGRGRGDRLGGHRPRRR